jgi:hypothetical protein
MKNLALRTEKVKGRRAPRIVVVYKGVNLGVLVQKPTGFTFIYNSAQGSPQMVFIPGFKPSWALLVIESYCNLDPPVIDEGSNTAAFTEHLE